MRRTRLIIAALLAATAVPVLAQDYYDAPPAGYGDDRPEIRSAYDFEAPLARYGNWVQSRFGRAWQPRVARDWRPYTIGRWVESEDGQVWQSDEPWGWATYHYGRWGFDERLGWVWVPGTEWAPAWVAWRDGDDYTGWAPLPPESLYGGGDYSSWDYGQWYAPSWIYVPRTSFYQRNLNVYIAPWSRNRTIWDRTRLRPYDRDRHDDRRPGWDHRPGQPGRDGDHRPGQFGNGQRPDGVGGDRRPDQTGHGPRPDLTGGDRRPDRLGNDDRPFRDTRPDDRRERPAVDFNSGRPPEPGQARRPGRDQNSMQVIENQPGGPRPEPARRTDGGRPDRFGRGGQQPPAAAFVPSPMVQSQPRGQAVAPRPQPPVTVAPPAAQPATVARPAPPAAAKPDRPGGNERERRNGERPQ